MEKISKKNKQSNSNWITLSDVARHCNVSKPTVSRVLNGNLNGFPVSEAMTQRVKNAAKELGYRPNWLARSIRNQRTHLIGLSCFHIDALNPAPDQLTEENRLIGQYTNIILSHPGFDDYNLVYHKRVESAGRPLKLCDFQPDLLDGMIYLNPSKDHDEFLDVASAAFPIVLLGQFDGAEEKMPCIDLNNRKMAQQSVEHLIGLGRRNILLLIPEKLQYFSCMQDRQQGYRDALTENEIQISDGFIHNVRCLKDNVNAFFEDLPCLEEVDAIFCATDDLAAFCLAPLKAMGYRIPEDIALIGFGDDPICKHTSPTISSIRRHAKKRAHAAIDLLLKILKKEIPYEPGFHEIETELVIRESTKKT